MTSSMNPNSQLPFQSAKAPLRPAFKAELKNRFMGETEVPQPSLFPSLNTMKRRSVLSLSVFVLLAFIMSIVYSSKETPEKILANAAEVYQKTDGIFYEKTSYEANAKNAKGFRESWSDGKGNQMTIGYDGFTGEAFDGYLYRVQADGTAKIYSYEPINDPSGLSNPYAVLEPYTGIQIGIQSHNPNMVNCIVTGLNENKGTDEAGFNLATVIQIDKTDLSSVSIGPWTGNELSDLEKKEERFNQLQNSLPEDFKENALNIIEQLQKDPDLKYQKIAEDGKTYYLFELSYEISNDADNSILKERHDYYIDAETYQLSKEEDYENDERVYTITYEQEILDPDQEDSIFDPKKYDLKGGYEVYGISIGLKGAGESACYNDVYEKLSKEDTNSLLETFKDIPDELREKLIN